MNYIVLEFQNNNETISTLINSYSNRNEAESKYHLILTSAAVSNVPKHGAFILDDEGFFIKSECFTHESEE